MRVRPPGVLYRTGVQGLSQLSQPSETGIPDVSEMRTATALDSAIGTPVIEFISMLYLVTDFSRLSNASFLDTRWVKANVEASL